MKLTGDLNEKAENQEEAKELIKDAGMELTDEEIDQVAGGFMSNPKNPDQEIIV